MKNNNNKLLLIVICIFGSILFINEVTMNKDNYCHERCSSSPTPIEFIRCSCIPLLSIGLLISLLVLHVIENITNNHEPKQ
jgi:hypothetical protein